MYSSPKPLPFLPEGREIAYVAIDHPHMRAAQEVSETRAHGCNWCVGVVVVRDGEILVRAGNNEDVGEMPLFCVRRAVGCKTGEGYDLCALCRGAHAEATAVRRAQEQGIDLHGASVYLYGHWWCCAPCWDAMIGAGITEVFLPEQATELFEVLPQQQPRWKEQPVVHITGEHEMLLPILRRGLQLAGVTEGAHGLSIAVLDGKVEIDGRTYLITEGAETAKLLSVVLRDALIARYAA